MARSKKHKKPKLPRGEYRARWHMVHDNPKAYKRNKAKREAHKEINEGGFTLMELSVGIFALFAGVATTYVVYLIISALQKYIAS